MELLRQSETFVCCESSNVIALGVTEARCEADVGRGRLVRAGKAFEEGFLR
jgi:hypothetical protein